MNEVRLTSIKLRIKLRINFHIKLLAGQKQGSIQGILGLSSGGSLEAVGVVA